MASIAVGLAALAAAGIARAEEFARDRTPLPDSVTGSATEAAAEPSGGGGAYARLLLGLLVVVGLIFALRFLLRRASGNKGLAARGNLSVVATAPLAQNRAVHLVRVGHELVLVGSGEHGVTPLRVYTAEEAQLLDQALGTDDGFGSARPRSIPLSVDELRRRTARR